MIATEVDEPSNVEHDTVDPPHHQSVAGDFDRTPANALFAHHREQRL
jgi:hypothetical protein